MLKPGDFLTFLFILVPASVFVGAVFIWNVRRIRRGKHRSPRR